ncbi:MAG TPA: prepilin peptidase [Methyloceanibacter sp.]|nr:prepilin peptidase [Methyloceanibacter sp.]
MKDLLILSIFPAAMTLAAVTDLFTLTVPNRIVVALALLFFLAAPLAGLGVADIGVHAGLALAALALGFALFSLGLVGGGDAKLFAASCLWLGPQAIVPYALYAALIGGVLGLLLLFWRAQPLPAMLASKGWLVRLHSPNQGMPYGIALAAAGLLAYPHSPFMAAFGG